MIVGLLNLAGEFYKTYIPAIDESIELAGWLQSISWQINLLENGREIELSGGIKSGISDDFLAVLNASNGVELVHVNLYEGGLIGEAQELSEIINKHALSTYVSGECVSACTIVYLGGESRYLNQFARLGFHSYSFPGLEDDELSLQDERTYLRNHGIDNRFIDRIFSTPSTDMWYPTIDELISANVVHQVVSSDEFSLPDSPSTRIATINKGIEDITGAETIEDSIRATKDYNKRVMSDFDLLVNKAKSPASEEFIELTRNQNQLALDGELMLEKLGEVFQFFETANFETEDEEELQSLTQKYLDLCKDYSAYIELVGKLRSTIHDKVALAERPEVFEELLDNNAQMLKTLKKLGESQEEVLAGEKAAYAEMGCDQHYELGAN